MSKSISAPTTQKTPLDISNSTAKSSEPAIGLTLPELPREKSPSTVATPPARDFTYAWSRMDIGGIREGHYTEF